MTENRARRGRRAWAALWRYERLNPRTRAVLLSLVAAGVLADALLRTTSVDPVMGARPLVGTFATVSMALFAWRPPLAVCLMVTGGVLSLPFGGAVEYLLAMSVVLGLVAATCSLALTGIYAATTVALTIVQIARGPEALTIGSTAVLSILGLASFLIGRTFREQRHRGRAMRRTLTEHEDELERVVREERVRIADELHDIVAHEITIVVMHARAMEHTDDAAILEASREAITRSAVQALADIRRMLDMTPPNAPQASDLTLATEGFASAITPSAVELERAGIDVRIDFPGDLDVSHIVLTTLVRVTREACMNVLKHAAAASRVDIAVRRDDEGILLTVQDDCFAERSVEVPRSGYGLARMRERVSLLGGSLRGERTGSGWRVTAHIPFLR